MELGKIEVFDVKPGSAVWLALRLDKRTASEAPAVMGVSPYTSRNQLLALKKGWQANPVSEFTQRLYDKGHEGEAAARTLVEADHFVDLPPLVYGRDVDGVELLASYDGIDKTLIFEHKYWNEALAENVRNGLIEPMYFWQLEQQMLVSGGRKVLFVVSDGTADKKVSVWYEAVPGRAEELLAGWRQFDKDLEGFELEARQELVSHSTSPTLPVLRFDVQGGEVISDVGAAIPIVRDLAQQQMSIILETDKDFADLAVFIKATKEARETIKRGVADVQSKFVSLDVFRKDVEMLDGVMQKMQAFNEKQLTAEKEKRKTQIMTDASLEVSKCILEQSKLIAPLPLSSEWYRDADFQAAMKGKRSITGWKDAADQEVARVKIDIDNVMTTVRINLMAEKKIREEHSFLFHDLATIINQPPEAYLAVVNARIKSHRHDEEVRLEAERKKIREEEEERARVKAEQERKAREEVDRKERQDELDRLEAERKDEQEREEETGKALKDAVSTGTGAVKITKDAGVKHIPIEGMKGPVDALEDMKNPPDDEGIALIERVLVEGGPLSFPVEIGMWEERFGLPKHCLPELLEILKRHDEYYEVGRWSWADMEDISQC